MAEKQSERARKVRLARRPPLPPSFGQTTPKEATIFEEENTPPVLKKVRIVLVSPSKEGNVGAVARAMANFGLSDLCLVAPGFDIGNRDRFVSSHALEVLERSLTDVKPDLPSAIRDVKVVAGTGARIVGDSSPSARTPVLPEELGQIFNLFDKNTFENDGGETLLAVVFGPEERGLSNSELESCDIMVRIPTSWTYPTMNLSHSVAIIAYELYRAATGLRPGLTVGLRNEEMGTEDGPDEFPENSEEEVLRMFDDDRKLRTYFTSAMGAIPAISGWRHRLADKFTELLQITESPAHKVKIASTVWRSVLARAYITNREVLVLMGALARPVRMVKRLAKGERRKNEGKGKK